MNYFSVFVYLTHLSTLFALRNEFKPKNSFKLNIFYASDQQNIEDYVSNSIDIINSRITKHSFQFEYYIVKVNPIDSFKMSKLLCNQLNDGRLAVIGIGSNPTLENIELMTTSLDIPYIAIKWNDVYETEPIITKKANLMEEDDDNGFDFEDNDSYPDDEDENSNIKSINMHSPSSKIMSAIMDYTHHLKWTFITILYQESLGIGHIQHIIRSTSITHKTLRLQVRQLSSNKDDWIYLLKEIKLSGSSHIIVDIETRYLNDFIEKANSVEIMTAYFHFLFTTLDLTMMAEAPIANISAFQVYRPHELSVLTLLSEWNTRNALKNKPIEPFLMHDALLIFDTIKLLSDIIINNDLITTLATTSSSVSCQKETKWKFGTTFFSFLKAANYSGLSGEISFNQKTGERNNMLLYIVDKMKNDVDLVGYWSETKNGSGNITIVRSFTKDKDQLMDKLSKNDLIVTTRLEDPYVMRKASTNGEKYEGNNRYEGYCIDLLKNVSEIVGFNYTIKLVEDGVYGSLVDGKWNGLVKDLLDKKADLAVAAMTINHQREQAIDFTKPFLNLGISILYKRPQKKTPFLFSFLSPLSIDIWLYMIAAYLAVSFILFVLARFSPYEWTNPHPCKPDSGVVVNQFTLLNSLWFTVGSLMQQGTEINPKSPSTRIISGVWSFFTLILISSYTANLAAFLTVSRMKAPIETAEDLSKQTEIKYGTLGGGSTENFFKESKIPTYERMWAFMTKNQAEVFVNKTDIGIQRVKSGGYAFLLESTMNEYARQQDCDLMQVGGLLDSKGYGIGTPTGSPWRDPISNAILRLQEDGALQSLHDKWWVNANGSLTCEIPDDKKKDSANELGLANVGGVFVVLVVGLCFSLVVAILEFIWKARQSADERITVKDQIIRDCKFALCHYNKTKKSSTEHFATMNLKSVIQIIPEIQGNFHPNAAYTMGMNNKKGSNHDNRDAKSNANNQHFRPYRRPNSNERV